ncbi:MAG: hypothetical protein EXQ50_14790 [Acidobacteria bacterium]|nr:hypothetical protein [Acidobacteriota bacterium]
MTRPLTLGLAALLLVLAAWTESAIAQTAIKPAPAIATPPIPQAVKGWRGYPLRDGVISIQRGKWRSDTVKVPVAAGKGLEYKLTMTKGEGLVYNISYGTLADSAMMLTEFHGHTKQVGGGDLMFYSKTGGSPQSGVFTAPWDGIHGWYLKNDSPTDVVVKLELAGFYVLESK